MESPEEDKRPEAPAARLGGWGRAAPLFECRVRRNELPFVPPSLLRLSEPAGRLLPDSSYRPRTKKKTTAVAIVLRSG